MVFLGNDLDEESIKGLYEYYSPTGFSNYLSPVTKIRYEKLLDSFEKYKKNNNLIDVGCGAGYFMLSASKRDWQVEGTEISDEAIKLVQEKGQRVFKGDIQDLDLENGKYDIATLFEVVEHAVNSQAMIRKLRDLVRPGGIIYITSFNYNSLTRRLLGKKWGMFHKEHVFYFTPGILASILKKNGFRVKSVKTKNLSLIEISKLFKKSSAFDFTRSYEKQEKVRKLTEEKPFFSVLKKIANFILNIFKAGDTISILAVRL